MNSDAELDPAVLREARIPLHHRILDFDGAAYCIDDAAELDKDAVACSFHHAAIVNGDCGVNYITAERPQTRQRAVLVSPRQPAEADNIGSQDCCQFPLHGHPS